MGGDSNAIGAAEAPAHVGWWLEAGVDVAIQEQPRDWLKPRAASAGDPLPSRPATALRGVAKASRLRGNAGQLRAVPRLARAPACAAAGQPVGAPRAAERARKTHRSCCSAMCRARGCRAGEPIGGEAWALDRADAGRDRDSRRRRPMSRRCPASMRREAASAQGTGRLRRNRPPPCRACEAEAAAAVRRPPSQRACSESRSPRRAATFTRSKGFATVATFHPRHLLSRPSDKALAWRDLLLLMEDEQ